MSTRLRKHHGLGNDFLVLVDSEGRHSIDAGLARRVCERRTGVGADGLIRLRPSGEPGAFVMDLLNSDGSRAETSGNGLRCAGQALVLDGAVEGPELTIVTDAGPRRLDVGPTGPDGIATVTTDMGPAVLGAEVDPPDGALRARAVDMGNPHLVALVDDPALVPLAELGPRVEAAYPGGVNLEVVAVVDRSTVTVRTWERGAGETLACGSGSCATVAALAGWGLVAPRAVVRNPGGELEVSIDEGGAVRLVGPAQYVCTVELP